MVLGLIVWRILGVVPLGQDVCVRPVVFPLLQNGVPSIHPSLCFVDWLRVVQSVVNARAALAAGGAGAGICGVGALCAVSR